MWLQSIREAFLGQNPFLFCPLQTPESLSLTEGLFPKQGQSLQLKCHNLEFKTLEVTVTKDVFLSAISPSKPDVNMPHVPNTTTLL